jgi:hypothetical protein
VSTGFCLPVPGCPGKRGANIGGHRSRPLCRAGLGPARRGTQIVGKCIGSGTARCSRSPPGAADTVRDLCWQCSDLGLGNMSAVFVNAEHGGCREAGG